MKNLPRTRQRLDTDGAQYVSATWRRAAKDYVCPTCCGEVPMPKGEEYLRLVVKRNGRLEEWKLCQRCAWVIGNKLEHSKDEKVRMQLEKGCMMLCRIASPLRKEWQSLLADRREELKDEKRLAKYGWKPEEK